MRMSGGDHKGRINAGSRSSPGAEEEKAAPCGAAFSEALVLRRSSGDVIAWSEPGTGRDRRRDRKLGTTHQGARHQITSFQLLKTTRKCACEFRAVNGRKWVTRRPVRESGRPRRGAGSGGRRPGPGSARRPRSGG